MTDGLPLRVCPCLICKAHSFLRKLLSSEMGIPAGPPRVGQLWASPAVIDEGPAQPADLCSNSPSVSAGPPSPVHLAFLSCVGVLRWGITNRQSPGRGSSTHEGKPREGHERGHAEHLVGTLTAPARGLFGGPGPPGARPSRSEKPQEDGMGLQCSLINEQMPLPFREDSLDMGKEQGC